MTRVTATLSADKHKIELRGPYNDALQEFYRSLPEGTWDVKKNCWTCGITPAACWRITSTCPVDVDADEEIVQEGLRFYEPVLRPKAPEQPEIRVHDAWAHQAAGYAFFRYRVAGLADMWMGCVSGDAVIVANRAGNTRRITLREAYKRFHSPRKKAEWKCRSLMGDRFGQNVIKNIVSTGMKCVVRVLLDNGKSIICTPDHEIATPGEYWIHWIPAESLNPGDTVFCNGKIAVYCPRCMKTREIGSDGAARRKSDYCKKCGNDIKSESGKGFINSRGYRIVQAPDHPRANPTGQVYEHIIVMERVLNRPIGRKEHVHHKNGIKSDNRPENLEVLTPGEHIKRHNGVARLHGGRTVNGGAVCMVPDFAKVVSVEPAGEVDVYDVVMADPYRNFVADGIVVHNCGKTKVTTDLANNWNVRRMMVMSPVSVMGVWRRELKKHSPFEWIVHVLEQGPSSEKKALAVVNAIKIAEARGLPICIVVNYESSWREPLGKTLLSVPWDLVVADEAHRLKGAQSIVSKFAAKFHRNSHRRLALTGTPMAHSPLDLFGIFRFLDRGIYGSSYHRFRSQFAVSGHFGADHIVGFKNQDELARRMSLITFSVGKEVLDLPPVQHINIPVTLSAKTRKVYDQIEEDCIAKVADGTITTANALTQLIRLRQITSGFCPVDETDANDKQVIVRFGTEKEDALADLLEDLDEPVVVACAFTPDLMAVRHVADKLRRRHGEVSGSRKDLTENATMPEDIDIMGVQIQAGGCGIDLQRARIIILMGVSYSLGEYEQLLARVHRPGQTRNVVYYHLIAENTIDEVVYSSLSRKREVIDDVMSYLRGKHSELED